MLVYTDSRRKAIRFIAIPDASKPKPGGMVALGGVPTSVKISGKRAFVAVNTSESYARPNGKLVTSREKHRL